MPNTAFPAFINSTLTAALTAALVALFTFPTSIAQAQENPSEDRSKDQKNEKTETRETTETSAPFQTSFSWHHRFQLGVLTEFSPDSKPKILLDFGLKYATEINFDKEDIWWTLRHDFFRAQSTFDNATTELRLVSGTYLRHDSKSHILFPLHRDFRFPAPFDLAVEYSAGEVGMVNNDIKRVRPLGISLLVDLIRDPQYRHRFAFGPNVDYQLFFDGEKVTHQVIPFSGLRILYAWEDQKGIFRTRLASDVNYVYERSTKEPRDFMRYSGSVEAEWMPLAINDHPLTLFGKAKLSYETEVQSQFQIGLRIASTFDP